MLSLINIFYRFFNSGFYFYFHTSMEKYNVPYKIKINSKLEIKYSLTYIFSSYVNKVGYYEEKINRKFYLYFTNGKC